MLWHGSGSRVVLTVWGLATAMSVPLLSLHLRAATKIPQSALQATIAFTSYMLQPCSPCRPHAHSQGNCSELNDAARACGQKQVLGAHPLIGIILEDD